MGKLRYGLLTYRRLLQYARRYWAVFLLGVVGTAVLSLVDAGFTWLIKPIINKGFIDRDQLFIQWLPMLIIVIFILRGCAGFVSSYFISRVSRSVVMDFRREIFDKLLILPSSFYDKNSSGYLLSTIIYNVEQVAQASSDALLTILRESSLMLGLVVVMFLVSWQLSLLFLITTPVIAWVLKWSSRRLRRLSSVVQESVGDVTHVADEGIQGYKVIRLYGGEHYEHEKFYQATRNNQQRELKIVVTNSIGTSMVQILVSIPIAVTLLFATMPSLHVSAGSFAAVIAAMISLLRPARRLTMVNGQIQKGVAGAESIFKVLDEPAEVDEGSKHLVHASGHIQFENVSFAYEGSTGLILEAINFEVKPGQTVAFVGRSGSGKTTLINLIPRFYECQSGQIKIDGISVCDYRLKDLRAQFSVVSQTTMLFNDTIAKNIAYGLGEDISESHIIEAATAAHVMEFATELPQGLNTVVGEDGVLLSGGQRQRIAIARAILKNAPILILDEATSALDTHAERHIQEALDNLMHKCTTLVVAHRLSTIEKADKILVLDQGKIVEQGTHESLTSQAGAYAKLYESHMVSA